MGDWEGCAEGWVGVREIRGESRGCGGGEEGLRSEVVGRKEGRGEEEEGGRGYS